MVVGLVETLVSYYSLTVVQLVSTNITGIISYLNKMEENDFKMTTPC